MLGRITRHSVARGVHVKRAPSLQEGCPKHAGPRPRPGGDPARLRHAAQAAVQRYATQAANTMAVVAAGSGVIGGFGRPAGNVIAPGMAPNTCIGLSCRAGLVLAEPLSLALLATAALVVLLLRQALNYIQDDRSRVTPAPVITIG